MKINDVQGRTNAALTGRQGAAYGSLPFTQQIDFFRQKVNMPTEAWTDLWQGMHSRSFVVAGAMRDGLLTDLRSAVDKAISKGTTLAEFRKDFDGLVERHGWTYNGGRNWRTRVIYDTNLRQSYNAGREKQMADPELRKARPYGLYRHGNSLNPRQEHLAWDGLVLPLDDSFWETHTPQNGWGCHCSKHMVSDRDVERMGLKVAEKAPPMNYREVEVGVRGPSPRTVKVPEGIDPGFAYNPGTAAWGRQLSEQAMNSWKAQGAAAWKPLSHGTPATYNRPGRIALDAPVAKLGNRLNSKEEVAEALRLQIGGAETVIKTPTGLPVLVNAENLASHVPLDRSQYLPLLKETLEMPFEQWLSFEEHKGTGKVVMRSRVIKAFDLGKGRGLLVVANARRGMLEAWTILPTSKWDYLEKNRKGMLLYGR